MSASSSADPDLELLSKYRDADGPLSERLAAFATAHRRRYPAYSDAVDKLVARLNDAGGWKDAPDVGEEMPPFMLPDETGRLVNLQSLCADGPVAIMFHRGHWCPYCRMNLRAVAREKDRIATTGGRIVVIQPERQQFAGEFRSDAGAPFPILTDMDNGYALSLNLAIWVGPDITKMYARSGYDLPRYQGNDAWMVPIPATFVVGRDGKVAARFIDPDFRKRMELDDLLAALKAAN
jgi:peroxiredoxin